MKFEYDVIFIPDGVNPRDVNDTRCVTMTSDTRLESKERLEQEARKNAIYQREIDKYAVRNYWHVACCEMRLINSPWSDTDDISDYMRDNHNVESIPRTEDSWRHKSIECSFESIDRRREVQKAIENTFNGKVPLATQRSNMRITLRAKANVGLSDFQEAKSVFKKHED